MKRKNEICPSKPSFSRKSNLRIYQIYLNNRREKYVKNVGQNCFVWAVNFKFSRLGTRILDKFPNSILSKMKHFIKKNFLLRSLLIFERRKQPSVNCSSLSLSNLESTKIQVYSINFQTRLFFFFFKHEGFNEKISFHVLYLLLHVELKTFC